MGRTPQKQQNCNKSKSTRSASVPKTRTFKNGVNNKKKTKQRNTIDQYLNNNTSNIQQTQKRNQFKNKNRKCNNVGSKTQNNGNNNNRREPLANITNNNIGNVANTTNNINETDFNMHNIDNMSSDDNDSDLQMDLSTNTPKGPPPGFPKKRTYSQIAASTTNNIESSLEPTTKRQRIKPPLKLNKTNIIRPPPPPPSVPIIIIICPNRHY